MAKECFVCGKGRISGNNVSHALNRTRRSWSPNLRRVRAIVQGSPKRIRVCARCLRAGKVERAV